MALRPPPPTHSISAVPQHAPLPSHPPGYNVLSASDAVGMGLNLAIRRVVFTSLRKFDGTQERQLTTAEIKQVGLVGVGPPHGGCASAAAAPTCLLP